MPHQDLKAEILSRIDFAAFYAKHTKDLKHTTGDNFLGKCPFHDDGQSSFAVNLKNGLWQCKAGCGQGDVFHYAGKLCNLDPKSNFREILNYTASEIGIVITAEVPKSNIQKIKNPKKPDTSNEETVKCTEPLPQTLVDRFKANLTADLKQKLALKRGLNPCTLDRFEVGYCLERQRYTIPVRNEKGDIVTIRLYDPDPKAYGKMINYVEKRGDKLYTWTDKTQLLGLKDLAAANSQRIIICEGEFDCMMLWEKGFPAVTGVTGASAYGGAEWEKQLKDKDVVFLYDSDKPGKDNSLKHGVRLKAKKIAKSVKIATLPLPGTKPDKDVTDWFSKDGKTAEELQAIIDAAVEPPDGPSESEEPEPSAQPSDGGYRDRPPPDDGDDLGDDFDPDFSNRGDDGDKEKLCPADAADAFLNSPMCRDASGLIFRKWKNDYWQFDGKIFKKVPIDDVRSTVMQCIRSLDRTKSRRSFALDTVANLDSTIFISGDLEPPMTRLTTRPIKSKGLLTLNNGVIDLNNVINDTPVELLSHSSDRFFLYSLPFDYSPEATCQTWERFLSEVILDPEVRGLLQEYCGYMLAETLEVNYQKFLLCLGTGRNGKSTFLDTIREMLGGAENVSAVSLSDFDDKFQIAAMLHKVANISGEMGDIEKIPEERLKAIVGGDGINVEEKFKPGGTKKLTSRLIFASNHIPRFRDRTLGLWRKMIVIAFDVTIDPARENPRLGITLKNELPGIFNWSLAGLRRLVQRGHFNEPESCTVAKEDISTEISSSKRFLTENHKFDPASPERIPCIELYRKYSDWCKERNLKPFADSQFGKEVLSTFGIDKTRGRIDGKRVYFYQGIVENEDVDDNAPSYTPPTENYGDR